MDFLNQFSDFGSGFRVPEGGWGPSAGSIQVFSGISAILLIAGRRRKKFYVHQINKPGARRGQIQRAIILKASPEASAFPLCPDRKERIL